MLGVVAMFDGIDGVIASGAVVLAVESCFQKASFDIDHPLLWQPAKPTDIHKTNAYRARELRMA